MAGLIIRITAAMNRDMDSRVELGRYLMSKNLDPIVTYCMNAISMSCMSGAREPSSDRSLRLFDSDQGSETFELIAGSFDVTAPVPGRCQIDRSLPSVAMM